jgi:hypothetical protein
MMGAGSSEKTLPPLEYAERLMNFLDTRVCYPIIEISNYKLSYIMLFIYRYSCYHSNDLMRIVLLFVYAECRIISDKVFNSMLPTCMS